MNRALFLDRDGVINEDYGYVHKIEDFHFREGIFDVCRAAQKARMKIVVVTNQAGIGRGYYLYEDFQRVTNYMLNHFASLGIAIDQVYHCPFHPSSGLGHYKRYSFDRKPSPGLLLKACRDHDINPSSSVMVGDNESDKVAAYSIGIMRFIDATNLAWPADVIQAIQER
jgi:D-glycero-D-manno-heptose 1,7-bisphosphate phosphatase